ncbi:hypothetical protein [Vreelandella venusta]|uniref:hypothetical protein n=1 Tax=Vreelandella venusta TaxID=44935 RepID=UPI00200DA47E|nr:hypothetical protein [Halomonas venusta]UQI42326.1 hypothetical protein M3L73_08695 [Halomonas venusta]
MADTTGSLGNRWQGMLLIVDSSADAIVDVEEIHEWQPSEVKAACSNGWEPGYLTWCLSSVRAITDNPIFNSVAVSAKRKLNEVGLV